MSSAARLLRPGGHLVIVDYAPHDDESQRDHGDVWLGFEASKLRALVENAALAVVTIAPMPGASNPLPLQLAVGRRVLP